LLEFTLSEYLTDASLSRFTWIPGKSMPKVGEGLFEPVKPRTLPRKRHFLHHITVEIVAGGVDLACCEYPVNKLADTGFMVFGHTTSSGETCM
jgi:hypothetical protein